MANCVPKRWRKQPSGTAKQFLKGRRNMNWSVQPHGDLDPWIYYSCVSLVIWRFSGGFRQGPGCPGRIRTHPAAAENLIVILLDVRRSFDPLLAKLLAARAGPWTRAKRFFLSQEPWKELDGILLQKTSQKWHVTKDYVNLGLRRAIELWGAFTYAPTHVGIDHFSLTICFSAPFYPQLPEESCQKKRKQLLASGIWLHVPRLYIIVTCYSLWCHTIAYSLMCCSLYCIMIP